MGIRTRHLMNIRKIAGRKARKAVMAGLSIGAALCGGYLAGGWATAQAAPPQAQAGRTAPQDPYQRSARIYNYNFFAGSGTPRGEEIYFFRCWMCHNQYTIDANAPNSAPTLRDLYKRPRLISGKPVNDETVAEKIRNGGPKMPAYRHVLNDTDMAELLSYFREGQCCWDEDNPPVNPWYKPNR